MAQTHRFDHHRLSGRILMALGLGVLIGLVLNVTVAGEEWVQDWILNGLLGVVGEVFIRLLTMLVVPIVFVSLVSGVSALSDPKSLGRMGGCALALYLTTTGIAVALALSAAVIFQPGIGAVPTETVARTIAEAPPFTQVLINIVPRNPVEALAQGAMLPVIVFSILLGLSISFAGDKGKRIASFFDDLNAVVMRLVGIVMTVAPYGVFALITVMIATTGWGAFVGVLKYVALVFAVLLIQGFIVYPSFLHFLARVNPVIFWIKMRDVLTFAFSTASSGATIPVTMRAVQERIGVSHKVSSFTIPLGATINMDGTAIMQGLATGFIAQYYGIDLSISQYLMVVAMVIMASVGTAGVPGVGLVLLAGVLTQVGLPVEGVALILGVDRILDMTRTAVNVAGDAVVSIVVGRAEGEFDDAVFRDPEAGLRAAPAPPNPPVA
jgi:Na+/H+-dicarboxylate symporter